MLIIFTGNGKGKTTASLGQALRAVGDGKKVLMVQFIKGPWKSGEDTSQERLAPDFKIVKTGKGFVGIAGHDDLPFEEHQQAAEEGLKYAHSEVSSKEWNIVILDEIWNALDLKLIKPEAIQDFIDKYVFKLEHLILTGRECPQEFIDQANLVTEMREIKHPFAQGIVGRKGLEF
jgi:cob(I)alamin adenosyltransferase